MSVMYEQIVPLQRKNSLFKVLKRMVLLHRELFLPEKILKMKIRLAAMANSLARQLSGVLIWCSWIGSELAHQTTRSWHTWQPCRSQDNWKPGLSTIGNQVSAQLETRSQDNWKPGLSTIGNQVSAQLENRSQDNWKPGLSTIGNQVPGQLETRSQHNWKTGFNTIGNQVSAQLETRSQHNWKPGLSTIGKQVSTHLAIRSQHTQVSVQTVHVLEWGPVNTGILCVPQEGKFCMKELRFLLPTTMLWILVWDFTLTCSATPEVFGVIILQKSS